MRAFIPYTQPGDYGITTELYRVNRSGDVIEHVDPESIGSITIACNENTNPKRTATIETDYPGDFTPFTDFLMPHMTITDPEGNSVSGPQGIYMVMPSSSITNAGGLSGTIECRDLSQIFVMDTSESFTVPAGTDRGDAIREQALEMGFAPDRVQIPSFGVIQEDIRVWDPGTTAMQYLTDLASGSNWYTPWFDNRGRLVSAPYRPLTDIPPSWIYTNDNDEDAADIEGEIREEPDWNRLANKVIVRRIGDQDNPTISYTATNNNPGSPASFANLGVWITKILDNPDLVDEAAAKVQADQLLSESASHYRKLTLPSFPVIDADLHQAVGLEIVVEGQEVYTGTFWRTGYTLTLDGSQTSFSQNLARVEAWQT